ncbi:hypothetical protein BSZ36_17605 [Rubricoccus marinus]|uniref:Plasmid encoded RepA protein n=1 Tax=Rubricoccus marinus TaxID=716817 RepID=A0A259TU50_9BACT|nr:hypothetical protein BSZ36_17605 [Rubricoccus marinus]
MSETPHAKPSPGDRTPSRPSRAELAAQTRRDNRNRRVTHILSQRPEDAGAIAMNPTTFVQAMLPHKERYLLGADGERVTIHGVGGKPQPLLATTYAATNGSFTLTIRAGTKRGPNHVHPEVSRGIPFGGLARLLLCYIITEAQIKKRRTIDLGTTLTDFCERVDITPSGGEHGRIAYVIDQLQRLSTAVVDYRWDTFEGPHAHQRGESILFVDSYHFWHCAATPTSEPADGGTITLSDRFWHEIVVGSCFPIDFRKAQLFRARPTAYDLYLWLTYRLSGLERTGRPEVVVNYDQLHAQLGSHYKTDEHGKLTASAKKNFGYKVRDAIRAIAAVWPELHVEFPRGRVVVRSTGPDVQTRQAKRAK